MTLGPTLSSTLSIGRHRVRNRVMALPHGQNLLDPDRLVRYCGEIAQKSAGILVLGAGIVSPESWRPTLVRAFDMSSLRLLRPAIEAVHRERGLVVLQLVHQGVEARPSDPLGILVGPSESGSTFGGYARFLEKPELASIVQSHGEAAAHAAAVGFDGVEIHSAHNYLLHQFLSPGINTRGDEYGGSLDGRSRLLLEILLCVRQRIPNLIIGARVPFGLSGLYGIECEEAAQLIERIDQLGLLDYVTVTVASKPNLYVFDRSFPEGGLRSQTRALRARVRHVKVVLSQGVSTPEVASDLVRLGDTDMVGVARSLIADPAWGDKVIAGGAAIRPCLALMTCRQAVKEGSTRCAVNTTAYGRTEEPGPILDSPVRAVVIGGGPAGCSAALALAARGAKVTLFERRPRLGGKARLAGQIGCRPQWTAYADYWESRVERDQRIRVVTGSQVAMSDVDACQPDLVVSAVGTEPCASSIPGIPAEPCEVLLAEPALIRGVAVVLDEVGSWSALGAVEVLLEMRAALRYITPLERVLDRVPEEIRTGLLERLHGEDFRAWTSAQLSASEAGLTVKGAWGEVDYLPDMEPVFHAGRERPREMRGLVSSPSRRVVSVGDATGFLGVEHAVRGGEQIGLRLERLL